MVPRIVMNRLWFNCNAIFLSRLFIAICRNTPRAYIKKKHCILPPFRRLFSWSNRLSNYHSFIGNYWLSDKTSFITDNVPRISVLLYARKPGGSMMCKEYQLCRWLIDQSDALVKQVWEPVATWLISHFYGPVVWAQGIGLKNTN